MKLKGFTLIEIIIVVSIMSLFFGASIAYYGQYSEQKKLDTEVHKLDDFLHLMQKKAIAGDVSEPCANFSGYQIQFTEDDQYAGYICCDSACSTKTLIKSYTLDSPLTFDYLESSIYFQSLTGRINGNNEITVNVNYSTKCSQIRIETSGLISLINPCP